jgi:hypothetical protein
MFNRDQDKPSGSPQALEIVVAAPLHGPLNSQGQQQR